MKWQGLRGLLCIIGIFLAFNELALAATTTTSQSTVSHKTTTTTHAATTKPSASKASSIKSSLPLNPGSYRKGEQRSPVKTVVSTNSGAHKAPLRQSPALNSNKSSVVKSSKVNTAKLAHLPPPPPTDLWQQVARDFTLPHDENRSEVQAQIAWFVNHPKYMQRVASHATYYMYYIHEQVTRRHLPGELVLLPMIESAYDPYAYSWVGAAGIWQMMPRTGLGFGLKQDWWYDGRKAIVPSTQAALDYLVYLHNFFNGDWLLATAAYNFGEGNVQNAVSRNASLGKSTQFWALQLPLETESYVPRLLALSAIVANPHKYGVTLPFIPNRPYFGVLQLNQQLELTRIAQMANVSLTELYELNPGFTRFATEPASRYQLLLPTDKIGIFETNLAALDRGGYQSYPQSSTTLASAAPTTSSITYAKATANTPDATYTSATPVTAYANTAPAAAYVSAAPDRSHTTYATTPPPATYARATPAALPTSFHASPEVDAPMPQKTAIRTPKTSTSSVTTYIVKPHETLYSIARSHDITVAQLEQLNHLKNTGIKTGDVLVLS